MTLLALVIVMLLTLKLSAVLCGAYLRLARRRQILATPNERSAHSVPTPHGGGVPLLIAFVGGLVMAAVVGVTWLPVLLVITAAALLLMLVGVLDDLRGLSVKLRLTAYLFISVVSCSYLLQPQADSSVSVALSTIVFASLALLWMLNLYNFMDGIDGLAAAQAVVAFAGAALLSVDVAEYRWYCLLLSAVYGGFLFWNSPPAKLFMGDAGSVPTGFLVGALALVGHQLGALSLACWLILLAVFITDATWTLLWRMLTGQPFTEGHQLHAYQRLGRHWRSHRSVNVLFLVIALTWLLPLAWGASRHPEYAILFVILAYLPFGLGMAKVRRLP